MMAAIVMLVTVLSLSAVVWAGPFEHFYDYQNPDGTYSYYFEPGEYMQPVFVTMDKNWYQLTRVVIEDAGASFYHKASYDAYADQGMKGGLLFTIGACVDSSFQELPSFRYIGFDDENAMNYYAQLPSDYQAYTADDSIRVEYDSLWAGVEKVIAGIRIGTDPYHTAHPDEEPVVAVGGNDPGDPDYVPDETEPEVLSSGDFNYWIHADGATVTISEYTADKDDQVVEIPSEIDGYQVTEIGNQAFTYKEMKSVTIPDSVEVIKERAFEYCVITDSLEIPEDIRFSGNSFSYASLPSVLTFPARAEIEDSAFSYCDTIKQVFVGPGSVCHGRAFGYCDRLEKAIFGEGTLLESKAFEYCEALREVVFCGSVETEEDAFSYCGDIVYTQLGEDEFQPGGQPGDESGGVLSGGDLTGEDSSGDDSPLNDSSDDLSSLIGSLLTGNLSGDTGANLSGDAGTYLSGGWTVTESSHVTEEDREIFNQAVQGIDDVSYDPVALLATQVVAGMNYCFLGRETSWESPETPAYKLIYIWKRPGDEPAQLLETQDIRFGLSEDVDAAQPFSGEHGISITGNVRLVVDCPKSAKAGDTVRVSVMDMADGEVVLEVNGSDIGRWEDDGTYSFTMPDEDAQINVSVSTEGYTGA